MKRTIALHSFNYDLLEIALSRFLADYDNDPNSRLFATRHHDQTFQSRIVKEFVEAKNCEWLIDAIDLQNKYSDIFISYSSWTLKKKKEGVATLTTIIEDLNVTLNQDFVTDFEFNETNEVTLYTSLLYDKSRDVRFCLIVM